MGETIQYIVQKERPKIQYIGQALSGRKGIEMVEETKPDILLADIIMPGMDGLTMIQLIKNLFLR
jgi:YesN/AraC family two-component response regulator